MAQYGGEAEHLIASDGTIYPLHDLGVSVTGLGDIPAEYQTLRGYGQHGNTVLSWRLNARTISLRFDRTTLSRAAYWAAREALTRVLSPLTGIVTYRRVRPDGRRRDIDGWLQSGMSLAELEDRFVYAANFSLECPDPSFYDPSLKTVMLAAGYPNNLSFPFVFQAGDADEFTFESTGLARGTISSTGTWRSYPVIRITGPYEAITIRNHTTGASFSLGVAVGSGEVVTVDLKPGSQAITNAAGDNLISHRTAGTFVDWFLVPGLNDIIATGTGGSGATSVQVAYFERFIAL